MDCLDKVSVGKKSNWCARHSYLELFLISDGTHMNVILLFLLYNFLHKIIEFTLNPLNLGSKSNALIDNTVIPFVLVLPISFLAWRIFRRPGKAGYVLGTMIGLFNLFMNICKHWFIYDYYMWTALLGLILMVFGTGLAFNWFASREDQ